jgi:hypothetical protein
MGNLAELRQRGARCGSHFVQDGAGGRIYHGIDLIMESGMTIVTTLDVPGMSPEEYRTVMDKLGVERRPEAGIYLHATITTDFGYRVVEIWDRKEGFEDFLSRRLASDEGVGHRPQD